MQTLIERIKSRPRVRYSDFLIQDDGGNPMSLLAMRSRFDQARKAATDTGDLAHSQKLLGHRNREMTEQYVRQRRGERVKPLR